MTPREEEQRRIFAEAEGVNRANLAIRQPFRLCQRCDGGGYVIGRCTGPSAQVNPYEARPVIDHPVRCPVCNGEGLDPDSVPRTRR